MEKREYAGARKSYLRPVGNQAACSDNRSYDQMHKQIQQAMERTQSVLADITHESDNERQGCSCGRRPEPRACDCGQRPEPRTCGCGCGQRPEPRTVDCGSCAQRPPVAAKKPIAAQKMGDAILSICVKMCRSLRHIFRLSRTRA